MEGDRVGLGCGLRGRVLSPSNIFYKFLLISFFKSFSKSAAQGPLHMINSVSTNQLDNSRINLFISTAVEFHRITHSLHLNCELLR
jgi:hypothetical protein